MGSEGLLVAPGKRIHVAATTNRDRTIVYVNGQPAAFGDGGELVPNNGDLWIGATVPGDSVLEAAQNHPFEGLVSELVLVRRVMSTKEILAMYMAGRQER